MFNKIDPACALMKLPALGGREAISEPDARIENEERNLFLGGWSAKVLCRGGV